MNMHRVATGAPFDNSESTGVGSHRVSFWVAGATLTLFLCGASAPSPLYAIYQSKFGFSTTVLTAIFAVYAVAVLAAVLPAGELSDQVGRRPVIVFGLGLQMVATALFLVANAVSLRSSRLAGHFCRGGHRSAQRSPGRPAGSRQRIRPAGGERRVTAGARH